MKIKPNLILIWLSCFVSLLSMGICSAQTIGGTVLAWGDGSWGETNVPAAATNVIGLAAGDENCIALRSDGTIVTWGSYGYYQPRYGATNVPSDITNSVGIAAGNDHSVALSKGGTIRLWGDLSVDTTPEVYNLPPDATNGVALALGPGQQHVLVLRADGTVVDWGFFLTSYNATIPPNARNIVSVAAGAFHSEALRSDGNLVAWGDNSYGQITQPTSATNIIAIAAGWYGNVALRSDGTMITWGSTDPIEPSQKIAGFTNVIDIACNASSPFALRRNGTVGFPNLWASAPRNGTNIAAIAAGSHNVLGLVGQGPPIFPGASLNRSVVVGATAFFRALAVGSTPLYYQWICNGTNVLGATNTFLAITNAQLAQAGNLYSLIASNALGMVTNTASALNVTPAEAYIQPQMLSAVAGSTATFTASTIGQGPFTYQWQFNGINLQNATNVSLICSNVQLSNAGDYNVIVTNAFGDASDSAALAVLPFVFNMGSNPLFTTNGLQLQLTGVFATNSVILYSSTDLVSWLPIMTNLPTTGSVQFLDSSATNVPLRFYRATEQ